MPEYLLFAKDLVDDLLGASAEEIAVGRGPLVEGSAGQREANDIAIFRNSLRSSRFL